MSGGLRVWQASGGAGGREVVVLEGPRFGGVSPGAGPGLEGSPAHGWGNPKGWVPRPGGLRETGQAALVRTRAWGDLRYRGGR